MSNENVGIMRRIVEAVSVGDYQAAAAELDPHVEIDDTDIPESTGGDSFLEWIARWDESWESWRIEGIELLPGSPGKAVALFTMIAKGKGSGVELRRQDALVGEFRNGKAVKLGYYNDQAQALEAAGLAQ